MDEVILKCGCKITNNIFVIGDKCKNNNCIECNTLISLHPFRTKRLNEVLK